MLKPLLLALLPLWACLLTTARADSDCSVSPPCTIRVASSHWPGYSTADGKGLYLDILQRIYLPLGYKLELRILPIRRSRHETMSQETDIMLVTASDQVRPLPGTSTPHYPIDVISSVAISKQHRRLTLEDLFNPETNLRLGWITGYEYQFMLGREPETTTSTSMAGLKLVASDRLDAFVDSLDEFRYLGDDFPDEMFRTIELAVTLIYPAFPKTARGRHLKSVYDQQMKNMFESGEMDALFEKYDGNFDGVLELFNQTPIRYHLLRSHSDSGENN